MIHQVPFTPYAICHYNSPIEGWEDLDFEYGAENVTVLDHSDPLWKEGWLYVEVADRFFLNTEPTQGSLYNGFTEGFWDEPDNEEDEEE